MPHHQTPNTAIPTKTHAESPKTHQGVTSQVSQQLALADAPARTWEPRTIRLRRMSIPAVITHHARRTVLRYKADRPFTGLLLTALSSFQALPAPIGTRPLPPAHHDPEGTTLAPGKARRPPRGDTRQTVTPNRHNRPHDTGNDATHTQSTSQ